MTQYAEHGCVWTGAGWRFVAENKTGVGFTPEDEKPPPDNAGGKERKPEPSCAGNIGTGNDSVCTMAKLPLVMFELMVCKGTADTCALECILLTGDGTEACTARTEDSRVTQCCVLMVMTITGVNCMNKDGASRRS